MRCCLWPTRWGRMVDPLRDGFGNREGDGGAPPGRAFDPDATAVRFDDALGDGQPKPGALTPNPGGLPKTIKDTEQILGRDAAARIRHPENDVAICRGRARRN